MVLEILWEVSQYPDPVMTVALLTINNQPPTLTNIYWLWVSLSSLSGSDFTFVYNFFKMLLSKHLSWNTRTFLISWARKFNFTSTENWNTKLLNLLQQSVSGPLTLTKTIIFVSWFYWRLNKGKIKICSRSEGGNLINILPDCLALTLTDPIYLRLSRVGETRVPVTVSWGASDCHGQSLLHQPGLPRRGEWMVRGVE